MIAAARVLRYARGMGLVYLFALIAGLGILLVQVAFGKLHTAPGGADGQDTGSGGKHIEGDEGVVGLFLSTRFWVFSALGFGLSGSLLHYFSSVWPVLSFLVAFVAGITSGLFATLVFRMLRKSSVSSTAHASKAVGKVGRAVAVCQKGSLGKVRIELSGQVIDFLATTDDDEIARGDAVLVEDMKDGVAHVSKRPADLA
jgi:membrane protein implicated in regulation of membrane protease activity